MAELLQAIDVKKYFSASPDWFARIFASAPERGDHVKAVDGVSLNIARGEMLGLLGESGSGKTTLIRTILRLTEPSAGQVWFEGKNIFALSAPELKQIVRRQLRMIFQHPEAVLNPAYTVAMMLNQALETHLQLQRSERHERIVALLQSVGLAPNDLNKYPHELSGGEKRRVTICRALATDPAIIFADEPLSGLDVSLQSQVLDLLLKIREERQATIVLISHDIGIVQRTCDRLGIMYAGRLIEFGKKEEVAPARALHPYTRALYGSQLSLHSVQEPRQQRKSDLLKEPLAEKSWAGCPYQPVCHLWQEQDKPDICLHEAPKLIMKSEHHSVACHFAE